jgi:hypothetical protein
VFRARFTVKPSSSSHPEFFVEGTIDGLTVKFKFSRGIGGSLVAASFTGILAGERLIGTLDQATSKGKRTSGMMILSPAK